MSVDAVSAIEVEGLGHSVQTGSTQTRILSEISLSVSPGESVALVGRSGSGKSTLLNLIAGLEPVTEGEIKLFGTSIGPLNDRTRTLLRRERIGFIYQAFNLIPTLTVAENILLPLTLTGANRTEAQRRLTHLLEAIELPQRGDDYPDRLSGGEQQRVALARAVAHQPPLLLADEPTGNLDADTGRRVLELLSQLVEERGSALLLVTHSREVAAYADRTLVLGDDGLNALANTALDKSSAW